MGNGPRVVGIWLAVLIGQCALVSQGLAQSGQSGVDKVIESHTQPIELYANGLGTFEKPISTSNPEAQAYFNQGVRLMYSFALPLAARSFREAWKRDPRCAICHWGEAWAWGSYINEPMGSEEAPHAYAAIQEARALANHATPKERALIDAMSVRYPRTFDPAQRVQLDTAYSRAMQRVAAKYPDDLEIATLYGEALFLLIPRRGHRDVARPEVQQLLAVLEGILARDMQHPGGCHLYVHATESTVVPERALACAQFLGASIPLASHINHMPSHTWNEVGRWGDSVRANLEAWHSDIKAATGEGISVYPSHNLHMLLYAASYDGQGAIAMRAAKDYAKLKDTSYQVLTLLRFGRFDELLEVAGRPEDEISGAIWDFAQGYAHLRQAETDFATLYLARLKNTADTSTAMFRTHTAKTLLGALSAILEGEIKRAAGDLPGAIRSFERAASLEDAMGYDEPEPLPFAARHWLGAALLDAKQYAEAERVYREELEDHPHNGWSLRGLQLALAGRGVTSAEVDADLQKSWARSDTWIRTSRF